MHSDTEIALAIRRTANAIAPDDALIIVATGDGEDEAA